MANADLLEWAAGHGVRAAGVRAGDVAEGGRGLIAIEDLQPGACILRVPERLLLCVHSARRDPQLSTALRQHGAGMSSEQVLSVHLLHEMAKGQASSWQTYLGSLPHSYTTAACFAAADIAALQAGCAQQAVRAAADAAVAQWRQALPLLHVLGLAPKWCSRQAWLWACSTLSSRTMYLPGDPAGALTPLGDFANHRPPPPPLVPALPAALPTGEGGAHTGTTRPEAGAGGNTARREQQEQERWQRQQDHHQQWQQQQQQEEEICGDGALDAEAEEYKLYCRAGCKADDQVFLCYGRHSNLQLLIHYGFVLSTNTHDTALLPTHLLPAEVLERLDSTGGGRHSSTTTTTTANVCYVRPGGEPSFELLRALRLAGATAEERRSRAYLALADQPISWSSEQAALGTLRQACRQALEALPTTAEEDAQLLAGGRAEHQELSDCGWVAVEWRLGYKQALQAAVALADRALAVLEGPQHAVPWPQAAANCIAGLVRRPRLLD